MRESNASEWTIPQRVARRGFPVAPKEEAGLRVDKGMAEPIHHDSGDVALRVKARLREHLGHLFSHSAFVVSERRRKNFGASELPLRPRRQSRFREIDEKGQHGWLVGTNGVCIDAKQCVLSYICVSAEAVEPLRAGNSELVEESPVAHGDVDRHIR